MEKMRVSSMCLAMNPDKLVGDQLCASSSNRNFKGRQGSPTGRTMLMSPLMVAAAAISGKIADSREIFPKLNLVYYVFREDPDNVSGQVYVPGDDIDTDRIIPARFMKCVTFDGLGEYLFYDVRHDSNDNLTDHALNKLEFSKASIMLSGMNFGCGSSREHAPQSLFRAGFRAIIAGNFAEIFW